MTFAENRRRDYEAAAAYALARDAAALILAACEPAPASHPYLTRKGIRPTGFRVTSRDVNNTAADDERPNHGVRKGTLVVPLYDTSRTLHGLQLIDDEGGTLYVKGTDKAGKYFNFGKLTDTIVIGESAAAMASVHEATGLCCVVAFDSGNLEPVARAIRKKFPEHEIIIAASNDHATAGNPGRMKGAAAADAIGARLVWPEFGANGITDDGRALTDFNDLHQLRGLAAVRAAFAPPAAALEPQSEHGVVPTARRAKRPDAAFANGTKSSDSPIESRERLAGKTAAATVPASRMAKPTNKGMYDAEVSSHSRRAPRAVIPDDEPARWADALVAQEFQHHGGRTLVRHRGEWLRWREGAWQASSEEEIRAAAWSWADCAVVEDENSMPGKLKPTRNTVADLVDALRARVALDDRIEEPALLEPIDELDPTDAIAVANGILDLRRRCLLPATPRLFVRSASRVKYESFPQRPGRWLRFLGEIWPNDTESIASLQEWFGYLISADTSQQKALLLVGPKRSGKGTILRILGDLVGVESIASPTFSSLATNFGLQPLIGKRVAIVADARLGAMTDKAAVAERILSITGEDWQTVDRKNRAAWHGKLGVRFVIATNELPNLADGSGALAGRFVLLTMTRSFYGKEDPGLLDELRGELPAILNWALDGLSRLRKRGRFNPPASSMAAMEELERLSSPIAAFVDDECEVSAAASVRCTDLFAVYRDWCASEGRNAGTLQRFSRDLRAVLPALKTERPRTEISRKRHFVGIRPRT